MLCEAMQKGVIHGSVDDFYHLSRTCLVKDEANFDRFDRAFAAYFKGVEALDAVLPADIPEEWLKKLAERLLTEEEKAQVEALGGWAVSRLGGWGVGRLDGCAVGDSSNRPTV